MNKEDIELLLMEEHEFDDITPRKRLFLDAYFDEMSIKDACEVAGCTTSYAYKLMKTEEAKKYLRWREVHTDITTTIDRNEIIREWKRLAFANADDAMEVVEKWTDPVISKDGETVLEESKKIISLQVKNLAKVPRRERRNVLAAVGIEKNRYGKKVEINLKAKAEALKVLGELTDLNPNGGDVKKVDRSGQSILDRIKKLSKSSASKKDE